MMEKNRAMQKVGRARMMIKRGLDECDILKRRNIVTTEIEMGYICENSGRIILQDTYSERKGCYILTRL